MSTPAELFALALRTHQSGNPSHAEYLYRQVLAAEPANADALCNLGVALSQQGRLDEAIASYQAALRARPEYAEAHFNLGNALRRMGQYLDAAVSYEAALRLQPRQVRFLYNLALVQVELGWLDPALASFQQCVQLQPSFAEAHNHLGNLLQRKGQLAEAVASFEQFRRLQPHDPRALNNLGLALAAQGKYVEATAMLQEALRLKPDYADAHNSLALTLEAQGNIDEALTHWQQALRFRPDFADALNNLGNAYTTQGNLDQAIECFRRALALQPRAAHIHSNLLLTLNYHPACTPATLLSEHQRWAQLHTAPLAMTVAPHTNDRTPGRRLRIGYVSPDFRAHTVAAFVEPLLAAHDHDRFHITAYANVTRPDHVTQRMQQTVDAWRSIIGLNDEDAAALIRADAIDILVDLAGHTAGNRLLLFARRPAPIQVTYFGYPSTTAVPGIDFRISDPYADPPGQTESHYTEQIIRLPEIAWCYQPPAGVEVGPLPADQSGRVTLGCFNNPAKVTDEVIALWARILHALPDARLMLLTGQGQLGNQRVQAAFTRHGIRGRITWVPRQSPEEYLKLYHAVDLCLDPFPYNGGVTTCDALWMGCPVVALAGHTYAARQGVTLLSNAGLPELAAETPDAYVETAAWLAKDRPKLRRLRGELRCRMQKSPLTDAVRLTRHLEAAYRRMWEAWCAAPTEPSVP